MRDSLKEIIRLTSFANIEGLKVIGTSSKTTISAVDAEKELIINVSLNDVIPEFEGTFGIPNLKFLESLLNFDGYASCPCEVTRFERRNRDEDGEETMVEVPQSITFRDPKGGMANFWFNHGKSLPVGADRVSIKWDIEFEPSKNATKEFAKLASIFSTPECRQFGMRTEGGKLWLTFGTEGATTHFGQMVFEEDVDWNLTGTQFFTSGKFIAVMKAVAAIGNPVTLSITNRLLRVSTSTQLGTYEFHLRAAKVES